MSADERLLRLENAFATLSELAARSQEVDTKHEARLNNLAESNRLIVEMIRRHDERADAFRAAREGTDQKLAALIDTQVRAEDEMNKLRSAQAETGQKIAALSDAQTRADDEMSRVRGALAELAEAMTKLTKKVDAISGGGERPSG